MQIDLTDKKFVWTGRALSGLASFPFLISGAMKLVARAKVVEAMKPLGLPESILTTIAVLELLSVAVYLAPRTAVLGAILVTGYLGGTILTHLRVGEHVTMNVTLGILVWLGLYLREPRLRDLIPLRKL